MAYVARLSAVLHGSMTPAQILCEMSYADGVRLIHQWFLDSDETGKAKLRLARSSAIVSAKGLF